MADRCVGGLRPRDLLVKLRQLALRELPPVGPGVARRHQGPLVVSGTLSVPYGDGPWPGVVLLSGGGPFDRDETSGPTSR